MENRLTRSLLSSEPLSAAGRMAPLTKPNAPTHNAEGT